MNKEKQIESNDTKISTVKRSVGSDNIICPYCLQINHNMKLGFHKCRYCWQIIQIK